VVLAVGETDQDGELRRACLQSKEDVDMASFRVSSITNTLTRDSRRRELLPTKQLDAVSGGVVRVRRRSPVPKLWSG